MNPTTVFKKWMPADTIRQVYDVDNINYGENGITFVLIPDGPGTHDHSHRLHLTWEDVLSYKISKEEYCPQYWVQSPDSAWTFYTSTTITPYLSEFRSVSELFPENVIHFLLIGTNLIADILSTEYPTILFEYHNDSV